MSQPSPGNDASRTWVTPVPPSSPIGTISSLFYSDNVQAWISCPTNEEIIVKSGIQDPELCQRHWKTFTDSMNLDIPLVFRKTQSFCYDMAYTSSRI